MEKRVVPTLDTQKGPYLCSSGEDEDEAMCRSFNCTRDYVKCGDDLRCILAGKLCDGREDCSDGSDESALVFAPGKVNNCTAQGNE